MRSDPGICGIPQPLLGFRDFRKDFFIREDATKGGDC